MSLFPRVSDGIEPMVIQIVYDYDNLGDKVSMDSRVLNLNHHWRIPT